MEVYALMGMARFDDVDQSTYRIGTNYSAKRDDVLCDLWFYDNLYVSTTVSSCSDCFDFQLIYLYVEFRSRFQ